MVMVPFRTQNSRLCSCHFKDGLRENGPSVFDRNASKAFTYSSPEKEVSENCYVLFRILFSLKKCYYDVIAVKKSD